MQRLNTENAQHEVDGALYDRFAVTIFQYLCQQVSNKQDAEDLLLEVFLAALQDETLSNLPAGRQLAWLRRSIDCTTHRASTRARQVTISQWSALCRNCGCSRETRGNGTPIVCAYRSPVAYDL